MTTRDEKKQNHYMTWTKIKRITVLQSLLVPIKYGLHFKVNSENFLFYGAENLGAISSFKANRGKLKKKKVLLYYM